MPVQSGTDRHQIQLFALEQAIGAENSVRVIDVLVDALDLEQLGFELKGKSVAGRPAFAASCLLKLYLYGYQNRIRSSRQLEKACQRNIELWWWLNYQQPCYKTIANFRKDNTKALKGVFRQLNLWLKDWGLFGGELVAVDGSKFRAQNSKKRNYNADKIARQIAYIDEELEDYEETVVYDHTLLKGKEKVSADFALIFTAYNLRRAMSILGIKELLKRLKGIFYLFLGLRTPRMPHSTQSPASYQGDLWTKVAA